MNALQIPTVPDGYALLGLVRVSLSSTDTGGFVADTTALTTSGTRTVAFYDTMSRRQADRFDLLGDDLAGDFGPRLFCGTDCQRRVTEQNSEQTDQLRGHGHRWWRAEFVGGAGRGLDMPRSTTRSSWAATSTRSASTTTCSRQLAALNRQTLFAEVT
jgi:hypothetical protein